MLYIMTGGEQPPHKENMNTLKMIDTINEVRYATDPLEIVAEFLGAIMKLPREVATPFVKRAFECLDTIGCGLHGTLEGALDVIYSNHPPTPDYFKNPLNVLRLANVGKTLANKMPPKQHVELFDIVLEVTEAGDPNMAGYCQRCRESSAYQMSKIVASIL